MIEIIDRLTLRHGDFNDHLFASSVAITSGARHSLEPKGAEAVHLGAISAPGCSRHGHYRKYLHAPFGSAGTRVGCAAGDASDRDLTPRAINNRLMHLSIIASKRSRTSISSFNR